VMIKMTHTARLAQSLAMGTVITITTIAALQGMTIRGLARVMRSTAATN